MHPDKELGGYSRNSIESSCKRRTRGRSVPPIQGPSRSSRQYQTIAEGLPVQPRACGKTMMGRRISRKAARSRYGGSLVVCLIVLDEPRTPCKAWTCRLKNVQRPEGPRRLAPPPLMPTYFHNMLVQPTHDSTRISINPIIRGNRGEVITTFATARALSWLL